MAGVRTRVKLRRMKVLLLTWSGDHRGIDGVTAALERRGATVIRLDSDEFPHAVRLEHHQEGAADRILLHTSAGTHDLSDVSAIWYRRLRAAEGLPKDMEAAFRNAGVEESRLHLLGLLESTGAFVLDPPHVVRRNEHKARQWRLARQVGFDVPRTLYTNDPAAARAFVESCPDGAVTKMLAMFAVHRNAYTADVVYTNRVRPEDLEHLDGLAACPMVFQERIPKALELRVGVVGDRMFTIAIDSQATERGQEDWRRSTGNADSVWRPHTLPPEVEERLRRLGDHLGQNYGGVDLLLTPDGRHVFLEWNPAGEFGWVMHHHAGAMEEAYADLLLGTARRRVMYA